MGDLDKNINGNTGILLTRNTPVVLVVGADSFLGSHLVDKLLSKGLQVVGLASKAYKLKVNLSQACESRDFHKISNLDETLELERLDYIFVVPEESLDLKPILKMFKKNKCRLLLISSIGLYGVDSDGSDLKWLKHIEVEVAKAAKENNLNARLLRLGAVFGPRMDFEKTFGDLDPIARLIAQSLNGNLQKETALEFSSRSLYIDDAVNLTVKCIFAGATAQKIFDGVLPSPIKVSEIKQVLLDPIWYESRQFTPSELPPWPTPNLEKTINFLNWHPNTKLVENLRKTLQFLKDNEIKMPELEERETESITGTDEKWRNEKKEELQALREGVKKEDVKKESRRLKFSFPFSVLFLILGFILITYSLIWPAVSMGWGILTFRFQLSQAINSLEKGEFEQSLFSINQARVGVEQAKAIFYSLETIRETGLLKPQFELGDNLANLATLSVSSAENTILGIQALYWGLSSVTGEKNESSANYFETSKSYLALADWDLSKALALTSNGDFTSSVPGAISGRVESLSERLNQYSSLIRKARALSILLPEVVGKKGSKNYLVLLQNNSELRPTGGFIGSIAQVTFEDGKLKKLEVQDVYAVDGQLKLHVEPPKEISLDLGQKDYFLRDSNWEPDFPTSARQAEWFFNKETGQRVEGVVALDISAVEDLLLILGQLDIADYNEKITSENLFEKAVSHAEVGFFPGTQAKKSFLTALTQSLFNKLFFLPNQNWPGIVTSLGRSLEEKHMSIYLDNPKLFTYLVSQNWASLMPREGNEKNGIVADFLAAVEANLGANKANYYLDRNYKMETVIGKDGEVSHTLRIAYVNRSPSDVFPGGNYKNRMRIYLPYGAKLSKVLWGESNILGQVSSFVDYGRSGYSFLTELKPKEQKTLVVDYQIPQKLKFEKGNALYRLDVVKQAGTLKDPFEWTIIHPLNMKLASGDSQAAGTRLGPQQQTITTDLSKDRKFEVEFSK